MHNAKNHSFINLALIAASLGLIHCGQNPINQESLDRGEQAVNDVAEAVKDGNGTVKSTVVLGKVGTLAKGSTIHLRRIHFTAVSSTHDTLKDSALVAGNGQITLQKIFSLKPLRNWSISARTVDFRDSTIHRGSTAPFYVKPADTVEANLNLTSRFTMYEARFGALPDSIASTDSGTQKEKLKLNRMVLKVDGEVIADTTLPVGSYFAGNQAVSLFHDYVTAGAHYVTLEAYGDLNGFKGLLYHGGATLNVVAGADESKAVTLGWVGPATGNGKLTVVLGRVGRVVINGTLPGKVFM